MKLFRLSLIVVSVLVLNGCIGGDGQQDLTDFIEETKRRPKKPLDPIPSFEPYEPFTYSATSLRNPFEQPIAEVESVLIGGRNDVVPDFDRNKEFLEEYSIDSMSLVGFVEMKGVLQALINYGEDGRVLPVQMGNYLGKNNGRIVVLNYDQVAVVEIVTNGLDGWIERPRILKLSEKE